MKTMRLLRNLPFVILMCAMALTVTWSAPVYAAGTMSWSYAGQNYPTKAAALAAMHASSPRNAPLTQEAGIVQMGALTTTYKYKAPEATPQESPWVYCAMFTDQGLKYCGFTADGTLLPVPNSLPPQTFDTVDASLADAVQSFSAARSDLCGSPPSFTQTSDWTQWWSYTQPPVDIEEQRPYAFTFNSNITYGNGNTVCTASVPYTNYIHRIRFASCPSAQYTLGAICTDPDSDVITSQVFECPMNGSPSTGVGNACDVSTGGFSQTEADYSEVGLNFTRFYHSAVLESHHSLGVGWTHNYASYLVISNGSPSGLLRADGHHDALYVSPTGTLISYSGSGVHVVANGAQWVATFVDGRRDIYNNSGQLVQLVSVAGLATSLTYNSTKQLISVTGPFGHSLQFSYDSNGRLTTLTEPDGTSTVAYAYDAKNNLTSATYPNSSLRQYQYQNSAFPNNMTAVLDESNNPYLSVQYDPVTGAVTSSQKPNGVEALSISYAARGAVATDALGTTNSYSFTTDAANTPRVTALSRNTATQSFTVPDAGSDPQRRVTQSVDANGNITAFTYDGDHMTSKTEAYGSPLARTTSYQYLANDSALPTVVTTGQSQTTYTYFSGTSNVQTKSITDTTVTPNVSRTWTYDYDNSGRVLTIDGPRSDVSDVTTFAYYTCSTGNRCGQVQSITDAVGNMTTFNTYNADGQPLTLTDPNGVVSTMTYDTQQRLTSRQLGSETTTFASYPIGLLRQVTLPDGTFLLYTYDGAHRLTTIKDGAGNHVNYTLDAAGNRVSSTTYDPTNVLSTTQSRVYNSLSQLTQTIGSAGTQAVTTGYTYDQVGSSVAVNAPMGRTTVSTYDALNRLQQVTDAGNGTTTFGYDTNDKTTSIKDPTGLTMTYAYNGFGELVMQTGPQTGTTTNTYDSAGNLKTSVDARLNTVTLMYDARNRVYQSAYADQVTSYSYDAGPYGKGRMTGASDMNHSLSWSYDNLGRIVSKTQILAGVSLSTGYAYSDGNLVTETTPSGQVVTYGYDNHRVTRIAVNNIGVLSNSQYEPFGPVRSWTWGNGTSEIRLHDADGNVSQIFAVEQTTFSIDGAFRITGDHNSSNAALSWNYDYDALDHLTNATSLSTALTWTYDAIGNRLSQIGGSPPTYNAANMVLNFNNSGRLTSVTENAISNYVYDALGQRILKTTGSNSTLFVYDESGHLLGEYTATGQLVQETVWLENLPIATLRPSASGTGIDIFYIHTDHVGTPRMVTRATDNIIVWRWDHDPFGTVAANSNPQGVGTFLFNLRFPGTYYDQETGLSYNDNRYYDSGTGRYISSDPIGLGGGINTYAYVDGNPLNFIDPYGLAWGSAEFAYHYFVGGGSPVDLTSTGLLSQFQNSPSVAGPNSAWKAQLRQKADSAAKQLLEKCDCNGDGGVKTATFDGSGRMNYDVTGSSPLDPLFSYGKGSVFGSASGFGYADCATKKYHWTYNLGYKGRDRYVEPLNIDLYGIHYKGAVGGTPYDMTISWDDTFSGGN